MADVETPVVDAWTSQSGQVSDTPEPDERPVEKPTETIVSKTEPAEPVAVADAERHEAEIVTDKPKTKRANPYEAVKAATGETARERGLREAAEKRADAAEQRLTELTAKPKEEAPPKPVEGARARPKFDDYHDKPDPLDAYMEDLADWKAEQKIAAEDFDKRFDGYMQRREQYQQQVAHIDGINTQARETYPDYDAVLEANSVIFPPSHLEAIANIAGSHHVIHALASDVALSQRIAALDNPILVAVELAKLVPSSAVAARPDSTSTARSSSAKPPINRVGGTASAVPVDPDDLDFGPDYLRQENEREKKRAQSSRW